VKLIPASEVRSGQLSEFFGRIPEGEQAFLCAHIYTPPSIFTHDSLGLIVDYRAAFQRSGRKSDRRGGAVCGLRSCGD
jgi:hypothetical protein